MTMEYLLSQMGQKHGGRLLEHQARLPRGSPSAISCINRAKFGSCISSVSTVNIDFHILLFAH